MNSELIRTRDVDLLGREKRYKRNANWILFGVVFVIFVVGPINSILTGTVPPDSPFKEAFFAFYGLIAASVLWSRYALMLKLRHIESIKEYRPDLTPLSGGLITNDGIGQKTAK